MCIASEDLPLFSREVLGPDSCLQDKGIDPVVHHVGRGLLQRRGPDARSKMRPDMMMVEMTTAEQRRDLPYDDRTGHRLATPHAMWQNQTSLDS